MKLLQRVCERLLREVDLGEYEFAKYRKDLSKEQQGEPDTLFEEQLYDALMSWLDYAKQPSVEMVVGLRDAMRDPRYSAFFSEPNADKVYRGLSLGKEEFRALLGDSYDEALKIREGSVVGDWVVSPRSEQVTFTSYSHKLVTAQKFSRFNVEPNKEYSVVLIAKVSDNSQVFFDLYRVLRKLSIHFMIDVESESEVIGMGPVKICEIRWQNMKEEE